MKVRCLNCGLVLEAVMGEVKCPICGYSYWGVCIEPEVTMMGLTMKARDKFNKESLVMMLETYYMAKNWLEEKGYVTFEKMGVPENPYLPEDYKKRVDAFQYRKNKKEEGLAFEIFEVEDGKKVKVRKIYLNGHIEGFEGDPCIVNHAYPRLMQLRGIIVDMLRQMNKDYRNFIENHLLADLPIDPIEFSRFYQSQLERIMNIKI